MIILRYPHRAPITLGGAIASPDNWRPRRVRGQQIKVRAGSPAHWGYAVVAIADVVVTIWRVTVVAGARHAGHADPSFYFGSARNLATGHGLTTDYVWEFLSLPAHLHHYAADYWQPLPSILLSVPMLLTGSHTVGTALAASLVAGALVPVPVAVLGYRLSGSHLVGAAAAVMMCLLPRLSYWTVQTESVPFFVLFALTAMAAAAGHDAGRRRWFVAGASAAAAYLCRSDGVLLLIGLALPLVRPMFRSPKAVVGLLPYAAGAGFLLVPWLVANLVFLHHLLPPTAGLAFLQSYEELFAYSTHPGLHDVFRHGFDSALTVRRHALHQLWLQVVSAVGHELMWTCAVLAALNVLGVRGRGDSDKAAPRAGWGLLTGIAVGDLLVQAFVLPVVGQGGTWSRSLLAYVPLLFIAALMGARRVRLLPLAAAAGVAAGIVTLTASTAVPAVVHRNNVAGDLVTTYASALGRGEQRADVVVMTRDVWQVSELTGYRSVMIPSGSYCDLVRVAKRYHATDFVTAQQRPELTGSVLEADGFTLAGGSSLHQVYRFPATLPDCPGKSP